MTLRRRPARHRIILQRHGIIFKCFICLCAAEIHAEILALMTYVHEGYLLDRNTAGVK